MSSHREQLEQAIEERKDARLSRIGVAIEDHVNHPETTNNDKLEYVVAMVSQNLRTRGTAMRGLWIRRAYLYFCSSGIAGKLLSLSNPCQP